MNKKRTPASSRKGIKINGEIRDAYEKRDKSLDKDPDARPLPPEKWALAMRRSEFFRPIKKSVTTLIDADVLHWLKSEGAGYQTRLNSILREAMEKAQ
ncbi:MAG TPA: BrnA antitoxin family protein [Bryobacteraceae bacterium]|jgi:uncharacterized protein (DUF4415 family)